LGLVERVGRGFEQATAPLTTTNDIPSEAVRRHHRQNLERATHALEHEPVERREVTSTTFAFAPENLPAAKAAIREAKRKLVALMENGRGDKNEVYTLSMQLFPQTRSTP
jgi:uncharacterized protein (TIGR02147 family)